MTKRRPKILVAAGKLEQRRRLKEALIQAGYQVVVATDGMAALIKIRNPKSRLNLIITDTKMPCLTGPELVEEIKMRKIKIPVIGMSNREECQKYYQYFWLKNDQLPKLISLVRQIIEN